MLEVEVEVEVELIQPQLAQKPTLRTEIHARALCASQNTRAEPRVSGLSVWKQAVGYSDRVISCVRVDKTFVF